MKKERKKNDCRIHFTVHVEFLLSLALTRPRSSNMGDVLIERFLLGVLKNSFTAVRCQFNFFSRLFHSLKLEMRGRFAISV